MALCHVPGVSACVCVVLNSDFPSRPFRSFHLKMLETQSNIIITNERIISPPLNSPRLGTTGLKPALYVSLSVYLMSLTGAICLQNEQRQEDQFPSVSVDQSSVQSVTACGHCAIPCPHCSITLSRYFMTTCGLKAATKFAFCGGY